MPEIGTLSVQRLREFADNADAELRLEQGEIATKQGTWRGRLSREIKIITGEDRTQKREAYRGAQQAVLDSLREIYGKEIGERAFRAGFGRAGPDGGWQTNESAPITGRHIRKMLAAAAREVQENRPLAQWIGRKRGNGAAEAADVLLGEKITTPRSRIPDDQVWDPIRQDLAAAVDEWAKHETDDHGFWILDLCGRDGSREHIGIHARRDVDGNTYELEFRSSNGRDGTGWAELETYLRETFPGGELAVYRAEELATDRWIEGKRSEFRLVREYEDARKWGETALTELESSGKLLRRASLQTLRREMEAVRDGVDRLLQEGRASQQDIARELDRLDELLERSNALAAELDAERRRLDALSTAPRPHIPQEILSDVEAETAIFEDAFRSIQDQFETYGCRWAFDPIFEAGKSCLDEVGAYGSLQNNGTQKVLRERMIEKFDTILTEQGWPEEARKPRCQQLNRDLDDCFAQLEYPRLRSRIRNNVKDIARELDNQRDVVGAKLETLRNTLGNVKSELENRRAQLEASREPAEPVIDLGPAPLQLRFERQGGEIVTTLPDLFDPQRTEGRYTATRQKDLIWEEVVFDHEQLIRGGGVNRTSGTRLRERMTGRITVQVDGREPRTRYTDALGDFQYIRGPNASPIKDLKPQDFASLSWFFDGYAFQRVYEQAVRRLYPPETPRECRHVAIHVATHYSEELNDTVFDVTFRGALPGGETITYQALDGERLPGNAPTLSAESEDLALEMTLHVPFNEVRAPVHAPYSRLEQPRIVLTKAPDGAEEILHLPPGHVLDGLKFAKSEDGSLVADIGGIVRPMAITNGAGMTFEDKLEKNDREDRAALYLGGAIARRGGLMLRALEGEPSELRQVSRPLEIRSLKQVRGQLKTVKWMHENELMARELDDRQAILLQRFLEVDVFDSYYRALRERLGLPALDPKDMPPVEFDVVLVTDWQGKETFTITMRGRLPDELGKGHPDLEGMNLHLAVELQVPLDQLDDPYPRYTVANPRIEAAPPL